MVAALRPLVLTASRRRGGRRASWAASRPPPWRSTAARQPARPTKHTACGPQPLAQPVDASDAVAVLVAAERGGPRRGPLHEVGHADAVRPQGVAGIAVAADEPGGECSGPEAVARRDEADAGVGRVHARVEAAHQQPHALGRRCRRAPGRGWPAPAVRLRRRAPPPRPPRGASRPPPRRRSAAAAARWRTTGRGSRPRGTPSDPRPCRRRTSARRVHRPPVAWWRSRSAIGRSTARRWT